MLDAVTSTTASAFLGISTGGWSAIAAWVGLLLVAVAALVAFFQLRLGQHLRAEQAQPYVVIYAEDNAAHPHFIDLIVKNFGATAARASPSRLTLRSSARQVARSRT